MNKVLSEVEQASKAIVDVMVGLQTFRNIRPESYPLVISDPDLPAKLSLAILGMITAAGLAASIGLEEEDNVAGVIARIDEYLTNKMRSVENIAERSVIEELLKGVRKPSSS